MVGSHIDKEVASQVIEDGEEYFSQNVDVMGVRYFGCSMCQFAMMRMKL